MPRQQPIISWQALRMEMEAWEYRRHKTAPWATSFNPPEDCERRRKCFDFRAISSRGEVIDGQGCVCLKVDLRRHQRLIQWPSGQCRRIRDYLVMEVNGKRVVTH